MEVNSTWRRFILLKCGVESGGQFPSSPKGNYGMGMWNEICKETVLLKSHGSFTIGDDKEIDFGWNLGAMRAP